MPNKRVLSHPRRAIRDAYTSASRTSAPAPSLALRLALPLLALAALPLAACDAGSDGRTAGIIHNLLLAAEVDDPGTLESFPGELPPGLPAPPPAYAGADLIVSSRQPASIGTGGTGQTEPGQPVPEPLLFFIVYDTNDGRRDVFLFYEEALDEDPWQLESTFSSEDLDTLQFSNVQDPDISGAVSIAQGEGGGTTILISMQDSGAQRQEQPPFEEPEGLPLPKDLPEDAPLYDGAVITSTAFFREPGGASFLLIMITTGDQAEVVTFYREALAELGWNPEPRPATDLEDRLEFQQSAQGVSGRVTIDRFPRDRTYTQISFQLRVPTGAGSSEDGATPPLTPTPSN